MALGVLRCRDCEGWAALAANTGMAVIGDVFGPAVAALTLVSSNARPAVVTCSRPSAAPHSPPTVNRLVKRIGERAGFPFKVHVHMLRHACGYARVTS
jgi:hypothetical protein